MELSEALRKLASIPKQVVATGGGAVVRPINWKYMKQGVSVFLDVPLDTLARRIADVGTDSRPLLHFESGDAYTKAFVGLFTLSKKRTEAYANADATVSLQRMSSYVQFDLFLILSSMLFHYFPLHVGPNCVAGAYWLPLLSWNNLKTAYRLIFSYLERPSMLDIAARLGLEDISDITPAAIAMEVLVQIENYLQGKNGIGMFP
ncbi:Shikimate kinase 3, chloroplastic [Vitis vinifera]|uniref:Shikimate kinase 3, chloroplastic n=1 Tax=Vitis vinifera TaxID=29760 RepID=A0A438GAS1_VITVI|nr:Shikimate kinase 3, chloroplastic [Vitis vinifera]